MQPVRSFNFHNGTGAPGATVVWGWDLKDHPIFKQVWEDDDVGTYIYPIRRI